MSRVSSDMTGRGVSNGRGDGMEESSVTGRVQLRCLAALGSPEVSRSRPPPPPTASRHPLLECDTAGNAATPLPKQHEKSQKNKNHDIVGLPELPSSPSPSPTLFPLPPPVPIPDTHRLCQSLPPGAPLLLSASRSLLVGFLFLGPPPVRRLCHAERPVKVQLLSRPSRLASPRRRRHEHDLLRFRLSSERRLLPRAPSPLRLSSTPV